MRVQRHPGKRSERGQTIILVVIALVSLLGMAALAIDVVTLYVARGEIQRAADAAALAGAHAIADSGATTLLPTDPKLAGAEAVANLMASSRVNAMLPSNLVAGSVPSLVTASPNWALHGNGNPTLTVTLKQANVPTFFAKIWGHSITAVSATATAEVYNPSNNPLYTPIAPIAVKPWLVANLDPTQPPGTPFITLGSNMVENNGGPIGESFDLTTDCDQSQPATCVLKTPSTMTTGIINGSTYWVQYVPACVAGMPCNAVGTGSNICPTALGSSAYEDAILCADYATTYTLTSSPYGCGLSANWDPSINPGQNGVNGPSAQGTEALINQSAGQDVITYTSPLSAPFVITAGPWNLLYSGLPVSTSNSIVTIPIIKPTDPYNGVTVTVVGFMQAFINLVQQNSVLPQFAGDINITVLNIAGCAGSSASTGNPPVVGGSGTSPVPVRLITPPTS